jgi:alpha-mannosidase
MWQDTLLNQFHDVLPGTTISLVVDDVLGIYRRRVAQAETLIETALSTLYPGSRPVQSVRDIESSTVVIDPLRLDRNELVSVADGSILLKSAPSGQSTLAPSVESTANSPKAYKEADASVLENDDFKMTIKDGRIGSLIDKHIGRELILAGPGAEDGGLSIYEDYPLEWDAWDVEVYHLDSCQPLRFQEIEPTSSSETAALKATVKFGDSTAVATVSIV